MRHYARTLAITSLLAITGTLAALPAAAQDVATPKPAPQAPATPTKPRLEIGKPAPLFMLRDTTGAAVTLADYKGKILVIEWLHPGCVASIHQHTAGPMRTLPGVFEGENVHWLAINSVAGSSEFGGREASVAAREQLAIQCPVLIDETGAVATLYEATIAPSVVVIDAEGLVRYVGAIDNAPEGVLPEGAERADYLSDALLSVIDATAPEHTRTMPTGCEIRPKPKKAS